MTVGWETLDVNEKALVYSKDGRARIEEGPQRIFLFREIFKRMVCYSASQKEYLAIKYRDGQIEHVKGPCFRHLNEIIHEHIKVRDLISLDANEALVVYTQDETTKNVKRKVQFGPTLFMIKDNEWLHEFCWHGTDPNNKTRMVRNTDTFTTLKIIPDQFYYNVDEVRTADDALLRVKLMMFYELQNIEKMLDSTQDPMADFVNCLTADVIAFAAKRSYEQFIETASELNDLKNYPQLTDRCKVIGYSVSKVVFRGYFAHEKLQNMHDVMIKRRTELKMKYESEVQQQSLTDMKLQAEVDRMEQEQEMELGKLLHSQKMEKVALEHKLALERKSHEKKMENVKRENEARVNAKAANNQQESEHLSKLRAMNVDVTSMLATRAGRPAKVTNVVANKGAANVHLYHNYPVMPLQTNV